MSTSEAGPHVLLVEDDRELADLLTELLVSDGYRVEVARDGQTGLQRALARSYAVLVLDRGLPVLDGLSLLSRFRAAGGATPVLVLSALGLPQDRVEGLDAGAEDYLSKPFDLDELLARLRALRRRHVDRSELLTLPGGRLDVASRTVELVDGTARYLSDRECGLLELLARRPTLVFSRVELRDRVFAGAEEENVVDTYVHYLRRKLGHPIIRTVRGLGYQLGRP